MSADEKFEKWACSEGLISESHGVRFVNSQCDVAQKAWQASRTAALEEAARICDDEVYADRAGRKIRDIAKDKA